MIEFTKMHGLGNDYVFIDCLEIAPPDDPSGLARAISDRHFGAGSDGLVLILPPDNAEKADCRMRMFNSDGSEAEMCGNAIRCVAKYVHDRDRIRKRTLGIKTGAGLLLLELNLEGATVATVRVDMGPPRFSPGEIGVKLSGDSIREHPVEAAGRTFAITCVSMGNPHAVIFLEEPVEEFDLGLYGPEIENDPLFVNRTNVEFVNVRGPGRLRQRTWERGAGETLACGTGASAVAVAAIVTGRCAPGKAEIELNGGVLGIEWREGENVFMTGPAEFVYDGKWLKDE